MLSDAKARRIKPADKPIAAGGVTGLFLFPAKVPGTGKWILRFVSPETKKRRDMGLGTYPALSISCARKDALVAREQVAKGIDPINARQEASALSRTIPTFADAGREVFEIVAEGFKNSKHKAQWINTLETYAFPKIGCRPVNELTATEFAEVLKPIWLEKSETASRLRQRMDRVMNWCVASGFVLASPLPAVDLLLPKQPSKEARQVHQPSLSWPDCPDFVGDVLRSGQYSVGKQALLFLILTAARSGEVRGADWSEVDWNNAVWTIPAKRMKTTKPHRIPLPSQALEVLNERLRHSQHGLIFFTRPGKQLSDMTLTKVLKDHKVKSSTLDRFATAHGFRSSFRDWASEHQYSRDLAERALAHSIKNKVEAAYHRTDLLDQRRPMMEHWGSFLVQD